MPNTPQIPKREALKSSGIMASGDQKKDKTELFSHKSHRKCKVLKW